MNRQLFRSRKNKMIAGVAGGIAEYFDIDPIIIRIAFIVSVFGGGVGILAYVILWIVIPEKPVIYQPVTESGPNIQVDPEPKFLRKNRKQ